MDVKIKLWYKNSTPKNITQPFINQQLAPRCGPHCPGLGTHNASKQKGSQGDIPSFYELLARYRMGQFQGKERTLFLEGRRSLFTAVTSCGKGPRL